MSAAAMKIKNITFNKLEIPFKTVFKHASAERSQTQSVIAMAESESGLRGYGEGCPRSYVTGETIESALGFLNDNRQSMLEISGVGGLKEWVAGRQRLLDKNPSAWCALELALLDLLGKENGKSVEALLGLPELSGEFHYTAVLGASGHQAFKKQFDQYIDLGFADFKIKVSGNFEEDLDRLSLFKSQPDPKPRVRLDANNLWKDAAEAVACIRELDYPFFAVEEPIKTEDYAGCLKIYEALNMPIILDESFLRIEQFDSIQKAPKAWIINLRISKMGGLLRSITIMEQAERRNIPVIIGAQVGETSILTRAALTIANACRADVIAQEGAFGTRLLERDITDQPIMFGQRGLLSANDASKNPGLGLVINWAGSVKDG